jgi:hypothetical protein
MSIEEFAEQKSRTINHILDEQFGSKWPPSQAISSTMTPPLENWLLRGGYPEIRVNPEVDRQLWFASYIQTYLEWKEVAGQTKQRGLVIAATNAATALLGNNVVPWFL